MIRIKYLVLLILMSLLLTGCASKHSRMSGSVAMKINNSKGVACLFGEDPKVGDTLVLMHNNCVDTGRETGGRLSCKMIEFGNATITRMINEHYAEFEMTSDASFIEGDIVKFSR